MRFPVIIVRDKLTGHEHIVGADIHDTLYIDKETVGIHFYNLQNGEGTRGDYEFVGVYTEYDPDPQIEFVIFDKLIELYKQNISISCKQEREIRDMLKKIIEKQRKKNRLDEDEDEMHHTGGNYRY